MTEIFNKKEMKGIRRALRKDLSEAEKLLWWKLRRKQLGYRFKRQFSIGNYVVDFYCPALRLIIEVDGVTHDKPHEVDYDKKREAYFNELGLKVIRFYNNDIYTNLDYVVTEIKRVCELISNKHKSPSLVKEGVQGEV